MLVLASETIKISYVATCACITGSQPFNAWFYPSFHQAPYTFLFHYKGLTWLGGVYSLLWWGLNSTAIGGYWLFNATLLAVDLVVLVFLGRRRGIGGRGYACAYAVFSVWFAGTVDPVDFWIIALAVVGRYRWWALVAAPLTKLPFGAPISVWHWVFTDANSFSGPENYSRYLILALIWMVAFGLQLWDWRRSSSGSLRSTLWRLLAS